MGFLNKYPYLDEHELNLDWIIKKMRELEIEFDEFKVVNQISFSGAWDITKQYPTWTIVSDNNIGYVSIRPVPAGVLLTDGNYWREVIDYSAQIAGLQSRVVALEGDMLTAQGDITTLQGNVSNLDTRVNRLEKRLILFLGDSYYLGGTGLVYTGDGWASRVIDYMGLTADEYILTPADDIVSGGVVSLPAFYPSSGTHKSFKTILELVSARLTADQKLNVTDVVVAGGYNDIGHNPDTITGISDYATFAKSTYPNAKLWVAHIGYSAKNGDRPNLLQTRVDYRRSVEFGLNYINQAEFVLASDELFLNDGAHPTNDGYRMIGRAIASALEGAGNPYTYSPYILGYELSTLVSDTLYSGNIVANIYNYGSKTIVFGNAVIVLATPAAISNSNPYKIYFNNDQIQPTGTVTLNLTCDLHESGGSDEFMACELTFGQDATGKYIAIAPVDTSYSKTVSSIKIPKATFEIPSNIL